MKTRIQSPCAVASSLAAALLISACSEQHGGREIDWAKAALERNPAYEIVATDQDSGVFTVRDTLTGAVQTLRMQDLIAAPKSGATTAPPAPAAARAVTPADAQDEAAAAAVEESALETEPAVAATPEAQGDVVLEGPGYSIARGAAAAQDTGESAPRNIEGPGYSITRSGEATANTAAEPRAASSVERRSDPIICQGNRLMRIDGETLEFTGDALIAERGCDLYISNARIRAGGVGLIARQARVHVFNSTIDGMRGSYEASEGAEIYVARSTFAGIGRRFDTATMNDLGNNDFKLN